MGSTQSAPPTLSDGPVPSIVERFCGTAKSSLDACSPKPSVSPLLIEDTTDADNQMALAGDAAIGKPQLTLEAADRMADTAIVECKNRGFKDISVFVVDANGRTLVSKTMIGVPPLIPAIAESKAGAAIGTHSSSRALKEKYEPAKTPQLLAMTMIGAATQQPFAAVPGGVVCRDSHTGTLIGAIGVSGASADEDEHCAVVGAQACGFTTEPAKSSLQ